MLVKFSNQDVHFSKAVDEARLYDTAVFDGREVAFASRRKTSDVRSGQGVADALTKQQHHFTLVEETSTSVHFALNVPAVVAVTYVNPANVGGLRTGNLEYFLDDAVSVGTLDYVRLQVSVVLVRTLSKQVSDNRKVNRSRAYRSG